VNFIAVANNWPKKKVEKSKRNGKIINSNFLKKKKGKKGR